MQRHLVIAKLTRSSKLETLIDYFGSDTSLSILQEKFRKQPGESEDPIYFGIRDMDSAHDRDPSGTPVLLLRVHIRRINEIKILDKSFMMTIDRWVPEITDNAEVGMLSLSFELIASHHIAMSQLAKERGE